MKCNTPLLVILIVIISILSSCGEKVEPIKEYKVEVKKDSLFGIDTSKYLVFQDTIQRGQTFSHLLLPYHISQGRINEIYNELQDTFSLSKLRVFYPYTVLTNKDSIAKHFVYEIDKLNYFVIDINDSTISYALKQKPVEIRNRTVGGWINKGNSFSQVLNDAVKNTALSYDIEDEIVNIYAWTIDFFHIQPKDHFKILFTEKLVDGVPIGLDSVQAVMFYHGGKSNYGFYFEKDSVSGFYDDSTMGLKKAFLKAPLKFSRISSGFTMKRYHPVQKRWKAHLGTDYAAPRGTPIWSVGDGTVIEAKYSRYNGNFVKVRHNATYTTQYLHMSKIAKGIKKGVRVKQGQTIGYVGSTGLATGPHLCYRFWKNGKQVNHRNESFDESEPIPNAMRDEFLTKMKKLKKELDKVKVKNQEA